jgi:small subunit ribosomal protein S9
MIKNVGRRKSSIASIILFLGNGNIIVNGKSFVDYMQNNPKMIHIIKSPLSLLGLDKSYDINIKVYGGGLSGQSEAIKLGIARSLYNIIDLSDQQKLRANGFLTRNSLCKERRSLNYTMFYFIILLN